MQGRDRGAKRSGQNIAGVGTRVLVGFGKGKVETQGQKFFIRQAILQVFQHGMVEIGIRIVGDYHRNALTRGPPFGNPQYGGDRLVAVNRFGERDLKLSELCALLDHEAPLGRHHIAEIYARLFARTRILHEIAGSG
jgi:hypothetical protein